MKKFIVFILCITIACITLFGCNAVSFANAPKTTIDGDIISWTTVSGADFYSVRVQFDDLNGYEITTKETTYKAKFVKEGNYTISVRASVNGKYSKYSNSVVYVLDKSSQITPSDNGEVVFRGAGTVDDPLLVESVSHLLSIKTGTKKEVVNSITNYIPLYYKQTCDLDLDGKDILPLAYGSNKFSGHYDGNGYTISNFTQTKVPESGYIDMGLFGAISNASIINLTIKNYNINMSYISKGFTWGAIAGDSKESYIENCHIEGNIKINSPSNSNFYGYVGMLIGKSTGTEFIRCSANGNINVTFAKCYAGGIVGVTRIGTKDIIDNCISNVNVTTHATGRESGKVIASSYAGGLIGYATAFKTVTKSVANGELKATAIDGADVGNVGVGIFGGGDHRDSDGLSRLVYTDTYINYQKMQLSLNEDYKTAAELMYRYAIGGKTAKQHTSTTVYGFNNAEQNNQEIFDKLDFENIWEFVDGNLKLKSYQANFKITQDNN